MAAQHWPATKRLHFPKVNARLGAFPVYCVHGIVGELRYKYKCKQANVEYIEQHVSLCCDWIPAPCITACKCSFQVCIIPRTARPISFRIVHVIANLSAKLSARPSTVLQTYESCVIVCSRM